MKKYLTQSIILVTLFSCASSDFWKGLVTLDELTFDKVVSRFKYSLVKFAHAFPYGPDHDNYVSVARSMANLSDIIVINLEIKDYGEQDSYALAQRYGISAEEYPTLRLFIDGNVNNPIVYTDPESTPENKLNANRIKRFLRKHTNLVITLDNCTKELDELAQRFVESSAQDVKEEMLKKTKEFVDSVKNSKEKSLAKVYVVLMEKALQRGNRFFDSEETRVKTLLTGKLTKDKRSELMARLNIIDSFKVIDNYVKDEL